MKFLSALTLYLFTFVVSTFEVNQTATFNETMTSEIEKHSSLNDCWVVFEKSIYDITDWIPKHPGGQDVYKNLCGTPDKFEPAFIKKHKHKEVNLLLEEANVKP